MAKRIKATLLKIEARRDAEQKTGAACALQNGVNELKVRMETELHEVRKRYEGAIDEQQQRLDQLVLSLEAWADKHPEEFPAGRKRIEFVHGWIGFRTGTPKVVKGRRHRTLQAVAEAMRALPWARKYVKQAAPAVNKEALIADRSKLTAGQLAELGLSIVQEETFYVEPKAEALEHGVKVTDQPAA